jgi:cyclic nucleotide-binding protein
MSLWLYEFFFSPQALARSVVILLVVVAFAMPAIGAVRLVALIAGVIGVVLSLGFNDLVGLFWGGLLAVVVLVRMAVSRGRGFGGHLNGEEQLFHDKVLPALHISQVRQLLAIGRWRDVAAGTTLTRAGEAVDELSFVTRGQVDIVVDGRRVAECGPGSLIGEIGMSTGEPATATAVCATPVRYLGFEAKRLYRLLDSHVDLQDAVELAIERSLRDKLHRSNVAAAHPSSKPAA